MLMILIIMFKTDVFDMFDTLSCSCPLLPLLLVPGLVGEAQCLQGEGSVARVEAGVRALGVVAALVIRVVL